MIRLATVLDCLLPGGEGFPPARALGLAARVELLAGSDTGFNGLLGRLSEDFERAAGEERAAALRALEAAEPEAFRSLLVLAYRAYYAEPSVLQALERITGYRAGPPQPEGYALEPFDPDWLAIARRRPPHFRKA